MNVKERDEAFNLIFVEQFDTLGATDGGINSNNVEADGFGKRTALTDCDSITFVNTEGGRQMGGDHLVSLFETLVFGDVMKVITTNGDGVLHFVMFDHTL